MREGSQIHEYEPQFLLRDLMMPRREGGLKTAIFPWRNLKLSFFRDPVTLGRCALDLRTQKTIICILCENPFRRGISPFKDTEKRTEGWSSTDNSVRSLYACSEIITGFALAPGGRAPFGQHQESRPLDRSSDIPVLAGFVDTIEWDRKQSDVSDLTLNVRRRTGSPWPAAFGCWNRPNVAPAGADQKERSLWGRECTGSRTGASVTADRKTRVLGMRSRGL